MMILSTEPLFLTATLAVPPLPGPAKTPSTLIAAEEQDKAEDVLLLTSFCDEEKVEVVQPETMEATVTTIAMSSIEASRGEIPFTCYRIIIGDVIIKNTISVTPSH